MRLREGDGLVPKPEQIGCAHGLDDAQGERRGLNHKRQAERRGHGVNHDAQARTDGGQRTGNPTLAQPATHREDVVRARGRHHDQDRGKVGNKDFRWKHRVQCTDRGQAVACGWRRLHLATERAASCSGAGICTSDKRLTCRQALPVLGFPSCESSNWVSAAS